MTTEAGPALKRTRSWLGFTLLLTNVLLLALIILAYLIFGSIRTGLAVLKGERLVADDLTRSFGTMNVGEKRSLIVQFTNVSARPIVLVGARSTCSCTVAENLPLTIGAGEKRPLDVTIRSRARTGRITERLTLYTDNPKQPQLVLFVTGLVRKKVVSEASIAQ